MPKNSLLRASRTGAAMSSFDITRCREAMTLEANNEEEKGKR